VLYFQRFALLRNFYASFAQALRKIEFFLKIDYNKTTQRINSLIFNAFQTLYGAGRVGQG
jgi:hypothetical protein